jgi:glycosyltransferase involved in cell wall biosynthesis
MDALLPLRINCAKPDSLRVAVDLSTVRPGGENGGVKPFILEYLRALDKLAGESITFVYLTWSCSHAEIRAIARPWDELVCVRGEAVSSGQSFTADWHQGEILLLNPPGDFLLRLGIKILYSPLSSAEFSCPGIPTIATIVDVLHRDYPSTLAPHMIAGREANFRDLVRSTNKFQCISEYTIDRMVTHYGLDRTRLFRTYIVIQHRLANPTGEQPVDCAYFLYPANAWAHKNHESLLVAYRLYRLQAGTQAWNLVLTGHEDEGMQSLRTTAAALGLEDCVRFCGHLPSNEFAELWRSAGALVFPSLHEGFGIPLLEAMHFNLPILCSDAGSLPEVAGDAAIYADARNPIAFAQAMMRLASDAGLRAGLVERGRRRLGDFSQEREASDFLRILRECANSDALPWTKGVHGDGWIETQAIVALPKHSSTRRLCITLAAAPASRRLRVSLGLTPFGGFELCAGREHKILLDVRLSGEPLVLDVPDAGNLNPQDQRRHGVILAGVSFFDEAGHETILAHVRP